MLHLSALPQEWEDNRVEQRDSCAAKMIGESMSAIMYVAEVMEGFRNVFSERPQILQ
jgi:hypothetical protein